MQESAWFHSHRMGIGWDHLMASRNSFWALTRLKVEVLGSPVKWGERLTVTTWSRGTDGIQFFRDWQVFDQKGVLRAIGTGTWVIVGADSRQVQRNSDLALQFPLQGEQVFPGVLKKIKPLVEPLFSDYSPIRYSEMDVNKHMNNVSYLVRFLDEESAAFRADYRVSGAELNFFKEVTAEASVRVGRVVDGMVRKYAIFREEDGGELCRGKVVWTPRVQEDDKRE